MRVQGVWRFVPPPLLLSLLSLIHAAIANDLGQDSQDFHHRLTKRELHYTFGVDDHDAVPSYALFTPLTLPPLDSHDDAEQRLEFRAWGRHFDLRLRPVADELISPRVLSVVRDQDAGRLDPPGRLHRLYRHCHYAASLVSHGNLSASVSACGSLRGSILMDDHFLVFQPLPRRFAPSNSQDSHRPRHPASDQPHVVFKRQAALSPLEESILDPGLLSMLRKAPVQEELRYQVRLAAGPYTGGAGGHAPPKSEFPIFT